MIQGYIFAHKDRATHDDIELSLMDRYGVDRHELEKQKSNLEDNLRRFVQLAEINSKDVMIKPRIKDPISIKKKIDKLNVDLETKPLLHGIDDIIGFRLVFKDVKELAQFFKTFMYETPMTLSDKKDGGENEFAIRAHISNKTNSDLESPFRAMAKHSRMHCEENGRGYEAVHISVLEEIKINAHFGEIITIPRGEIQLHTYETYLRAEIGDASHDRYKGLGRQAGRGKSLHEQFEARSALYKNKMNIYVNNQRMMVDQTGNRCLSIIPFLMRHQIKDLNSMPRVESINGKPVRENIIRSGDMLTISENPQVTVLEYVRKLTKWSLKEKIGWLVASSYFKENHKELKHIETNGREKLLKMPKKRASTLIQSIQAAHSGKNQLSDREIAIALALDLI
jgi:ppGpp synthetase/RelA/SpoT-type nucleotidyltranferase